MGTVHKSNLTGKSPHTGDNVFKISASSHGIEYRFKPGTDLELDKEYIVTLWQHAPSTNYSGASPTFTVGDLVTNLVISGSSFTSHEASFGNWKRLEAVFRTPLSSTNELSLYVDCSGCTEDFYFDDFRLQPLGSVMKSYVFDKKNDRLTSELDADNIATKYYYDEMGRITSTKREVPTSIGLNGFV